MLTAALVSLTLAAFAQPAPSPDTANPRGNSAEERSERQEDADRMICRREHVVGSNRPQRVCMTRAQWDAIRDQSRETLRETDRGAPQELPGTPG
ncbi:MAG: hypothetical protein ACK4FB_09240 [Brevundimonas sp.]|uniref:hypothetical protein n=1 Tax=Brevundimonas sp. TaxID=1871086 RepID=UPI003918F7C4